ncbi:MAG TPA: MmgE/PrpD family protein [Burkholderiales bacterium]|nr:MmgE/PrpD family protein [Burkholderiales bacterium]
MTILERLGAHAASGYRQGLSGPAREVLKLHIADTVAAWIAACTTVEGRALLAFEPSERASMPRRAGLACALARLSEVDDIHLSSATTPGAIVIPAALTLGAALGRSGEEVAGAVSVGYDLMTRLGEALGGPTILYRGLWPTYFLAPAAVAAVAARLLDLDEKQGAHALATALAFASPAVGRQSGAGMSRWLAIANAARSGVTAALAARSGFTGDLRLFEGEFFPGVYHLAPDVDAPDEAAEPGPSVLRTSFKPWCAARQTMAAVEALREVIAEGVTIADMTELTVGVPLPYLKMIDHGVAPGERTSHLTSVPYQMALFAFDQNASLDPRQARDSLPRAMERFMARISVQADEDLARHYPRCWPAWIAVDTPRGPWEKLVLHVPGDPERPFDELQVAAKFWRLTGHLLGEGPAETLLRLALAAIDGEGGATALLEAIDRAVAAASRAS